MRTQASAPNLDRPEGPALLLAWLDRFLFRPGDPTTLGLIRICCGLVTLYVHLVYSFDLQATVGKYAWYDLNLANEARLHGPVLILTPDWELKTEEYTKGNRVWSVWYHVTDPTGMIVVHVAILVSMALFTIGFATRITSVLTWIGAVSFVQRAPTTLFGQDAIMMLLLFYLVIGPSGAALSVDQLIRRWLNRRWGPHSRVISTAPQPSVSATFVVRIMQVHLCIIYFASGTSKLLGPAWWNFTATYLTMANYSFAPLDMPLYRDLLGWLCRHRWLWELFMTTSTVFTLVMEIGFPLAVWYRPLRPYLLIGAVMLHVGIAIFMGLVLFSLLMLTMILAFVPGDAIRGWVDALDETVTSVLRRWRGRSARQPAVEGARA